MGLPDGGSAMTADDVAENILAAQYGWDLLRRFTRYHNAIVILLSHELAEGLRVVLLFRVPLVKALDCGRLTGERKLIS
jgi:hypothetical protein